MLLCLEAALTMVTALQIWIVLGGARGSGAAFVLALPAVAGAVVAWLMTGPGRWSAWALLALQMFYATWQLGRLPARDPFGLVGLAFPVAILLLVSRDRAYLRPEAAGRRTGEPPGDGTVWRSWRHRDRGDGTIGHVAVVALVGMVVAVLAASSIPGDVARHVESAVCVPTGADCGASVRAAKHTSGERHPGPPARSIDPRRPSMGVPRGQMINAEDYDEPLNCFELLQGTCDLFQGLWLGSVDGYQSYADSVNALACTAYIGCGRSRLGQTWEGWRRLFTTDPIDTARAVWDESIKDIANDGKDRRWRAVGRVLPAAINAIFVGKGVNRFADLPGKVDEPGILRPRAPPVAADADGFGVRRFRSDADGQAYGQRYLGWTFRGLPADQRQAVRMYSQDGRPYSYTLRVDDPQAELDRMLGIPRDRQALMAVFGGKVPTLEDIRARIALVDKAVSHPLPESLEARRGLNSIDYIKGYDGSDPRGLVGLTHTDPGYTSTSLGETVVPTTPHPIRYMVHLDIPKGHPGLWIGPESSHPEQRELLLPRGVSYTFTKVVLNGDGIWKLYATVHPYKAVGKP